MKTIINLANVVTSFIMCYLYDYEQAIINVRLSEAKENIISLSTGWLGGHGFNSLESIHGCLDLLTHPKHVLRLHGRCSIGETAF